jgi:type I restriction enzyme, S subunit
MKKSSKLDMATLSEIAELNPRLTESLQSNTPISFVPMSAVTAETASTTTGEERSYSEVSKGYTPFRNGDVLVAKITPCFENGKIAQAKLTHAIGFGSTEFHVVRPNADKSDARYLLHFLRQECIRVDGARKMTGSAGQRRVPEHYLAGLEIPLPPLPEQRRIADVLDRAEALRAKRRAALALLDTLTQSIFLDMFGDPVTNPKGWPIAKLQDVSEMITGFAFRSEEYVSHEDSIRLCRGANVMPGRIDWSDLARWPKSKLHHVSEFSLRVGDVVIAMDRPWISEGFKIAQIQNDDCPALLVQRVSRLRGKKWLANRILVRPTQSLCIYTSLPPN